MVKRTIALLLFIFSAFLLPAFSADSLNWRPPAVPLVTSNPYFSIWSFNNRLTYGPTRHWTGTEQELHSLIRIDGTCWRLMGDDPRTVQALPQTGLDVEPTRTIYNFEGGGVHVTLTFLTPMLPDDIDLMSWPVTYLIWKVRSINGKEHDISLYFDNTAQLVVDKGSEPVVWKRVTVKGMTALRMGTHAQPILQKSGDNLRIDWGYLYLAAPQEEASGAAVAPLRQALKDFVRRGKLPASTLEPPVKPSVNLAAMALNFHLGSIGDQTVERHVILAYDQIYSVEYFHQRLRPYWRLKRPNAEELLRDAERVYGSLEKRSREFDQDLTADLTRLGGKQYSRMAALAYRQAFAAQIIVAGPDGKPFMFPKENFSNGCIGTVDVIYPGSPILLLLNPKLLQASLVPLFEYAESGRWPFPFAPHDLGTYPLANGQVYGGREKSEVDQMPVEETGNMLLMVAAIADAEGNAHFAASHWPLLTRWAEYLKEKGFDPANQLSTDDFAGHLAHNTNLSIKAIEAIAAYGKLADSLHKKRAAEYRRTAAEFARRWVRMAADGDHYRLAFDLPGSWSQKYNLVWDKILGFHLFPPEVASKEVAYYEAKQNRYGFPLDNRKDYTKLDWEFWSATLAENAGDWNKLISPILDWANQSPSRVPLTDWYWTTDGTQVGFQARSVVGGLFIKMLANHDVWQRWAAKAKERSTSSGLDSRLRTNDGD